MTEHTRSRARDRIQYRVVGMDCADDAREIEAASRAIDGVDARVSVASQTLTLDLGEASSAAAVEHAVGLLGYSLERLDGTRAKGVSRQYRRALWIVVILNVGFGIAEMIGGFLSGSQALKADALDFLGDGLITLLGVAAIAWSLAWRARSALVQGIFLAALGVGVIVNTAYRVIVQQRPDAELMGAIAIAALVVNVAAAAVLIPHRKGDANARAVWLFSRNDAIGNVAVFAAAVLVAWTNTAWPDLVVAGIVAGLFLHSASSIISDARSDLRQVM